ncbi:Hpt domain-containing protein [Polaribacter litorisediminis]|uniref:Hpt domain-containing protein n=1 Tax=Polaribacter litorisediminis TaxID=1908341 RepID=UPI001CBEC5AA|nr:Hpt domain-containing protein [Polaribacter litorisediminis]UAM99632.1 Hpt domain-containing protein [Polaribacter litorisediminis]
MEIESILKSDVVDLTSIKSFFASDKDMLIQLINVYLSDTIPRLETLEKSLTDLDYEAVRGICHFLKSSLGLMGVSCLEEVAILEKLAQNNEDEAIIKQKLSAIIPVIKESITEYKMILNKLDAL